MNCGAAEQFFVFNERLDEPTNFVLEESKPLVSQIISARAYHKKGK